MRQAPSSSARVRCRTPMCAMAGSSLATECPVNDDNFDNKLCPSSPGPYVYSCFSALCHFASAAIASCAAEDYQILQMPSTETSDRIPYSSITPLKPLFRLFYMDRKENFSPPTHSGMRPTSAGWSFYVITYSAPSDEVPFWLALLKNVWCVVCLRRPRYIVALGGTTSAPPTPDPIER